MAQSDWTARLDTQTRVLGPRGERVTETTRMVTKAETMAAAVPSGMMESYHPDEKRG